MTNPRLLIPRGFLAVTLFLGVAVLSGCEETVSRQQYDQAQAENTKLKNENAELQKRLKETEKARDEYQARLSTAKMQKIEYLQTQLRAANRRADEMKQAGFNAGALAVYKNIEITGRPSVVRGIFIDDWYYPNFGQIRGTEGRKNETIVIGRLEKQDAK